MEQGIILLLRVRMRRHLTHTLEQGGQKMGGNTIIFNRFFIVRIYQFSDRFDMFKYFKKGKSGEAHGKRRRSEDTSSPKSKVKPGKFCARSTFFSFHELRPFPIRMYALIKGSFTLIRIQRRRSLSFSSLNMCENDRDN